jgi:hypothetical protein
MTARPTGQETALERAREQGIRVARLGDDAFRAQSSEPTLRGPYLLVGQGDDAVCQCAGGAFGEICKHREAVAAALRGEYPWHAPEDIAGPGPEPRETRAERRLREIREFDALQAARRARVTVTAADYAAFFGE